MMLDTRSTFDALIVPVSPDDDTRERILNNRVYRHVSDSSVGAKSTWPPSTCTRWWSADGRPIWSSWTRRP